MSANNERGLTHLLLIDPQNDFCDIPEAELPRAADGATLATPALPVAGADADMRRVAALIERAGSRIARVSVTLDSHNPVDIAHPTWWRNAEGAHPAPFTFISAADVTEGRWRATDPAQQAHSAAYVTALARAGRHQLIVWPEHCLIGGWGHNVHASVKAALDAWARAQRTQADFVIKGTNPGTEHYSAVQAEVPDAADPGTLLNAQLVARLAQADRVLIAGEALSHCVANTVRDIAANIGEANIGKLTLLVDCASPVTGFEKLGADFIAELTALGMRTARATELFH